MQCYTCDCAAQTLLHSEPAHFVMLGCGLASLQAAFAPFLLNAACVNSAGRTQDLDSPEKVIGDSSRRLPSERYRGTHLPT